MSSVIIIHTSTNEIVLPKASNLSQKVIYEFVEIFGGVTHETSNERLDFDGDLDHRADQR